MDKGHKKRDPFPRGSLKRNMPGPFKRRPYKKDETRIDRPKSSAGGAASPTAGSGKKTHLRDTGEVREKTRLELIRELKKLDRKIVDLEERLAKGVSAPKNGIPVISTVKRRRAWHGVSAPIALEEKYRHLVERSLQGVLIAEGIPPRIVFANEVMARIFGYSVDDILSMTPTRLKNILHPDDREIFFRRYRDRIEGKKAPAHYELRIIRGDGSTGWLEMFATRIEYNGRPFVQATCIDITERKIAEERMLQSEEKYRTVIENIQDGYYEVDLSGNFTFYNDTVAEIFGYDRKEIMGMNNRKLMDEENARSVYRTFNKVYRTHKSERAFEWEIIRKDGSRRIVEASVSLIRDTSGDPAGFRGILRDVTEEKRVQQALLASERRYHNVYDIAPLAFVLWDSQCRITDWNKHAEEVFGWEKEAVLGKNFYDLLFPQKERQRVENIFGSLLRGELPGHAISENRTRSGESITCEWNNTVFYDSEGDVEEILSLALDITDRKNLEEELFQSRKMESIGRLAGGVAHDLNNMLTPILGYADMLLLDVPMDDSHLDSLIQIKAAAEKARDLTRQLLAFSRKQVLEMKVLNLGTVACGFEKILRRTIREDIELVIRVAEGAGNILTDASQIERIILNLAVNAQEAMPAGGRLLIEVSNVFIDASHAKKHPDARTGQHVLLSISDTGCGMDSETLEHMFEPFYTTRALGTGLGLSTVYGIVKQHNGSIWVSSTPSSGTTIRIYFPRAEGEPEVLERPPASEVITAKGETILIVEDEEAVRRLAAKILEKHGYRVLVAADGDEAIDIVKSHGERIDLLLTDVIMPRIDGRSLYRKIAAFRSDIRILYMSGYTHDVIANHGVIEEGFHFIQKPFSFQSLSEKVREVLDK